MNQHPNTKGEKYMVTDSVEKVNDFFSTADLGTAAYLVTNGCRLKIANKERGRYNFVFFEKEKCELYAIKYVSSDFAKFDSALKNLKNLIH
jgi:hypothetical protein